MDPASIMRSSYTIVGLPAAALAGGGDPALNPFVEL